MRKALLVILVAAVAGCSESGTGIGERTVVEGTVASFGTRQHQVTAEETGTATMRLSWESSALDLDLYLTDASCDAYPPANCAILAISDDVGTDEEVVQYAVAAGGQFKLWVDNFSQASVDYRVVITYD